MASSGESGAGKGHKEPEDEMKGFGEALKLILSKVGDFLDLFDLSFIVSGALGLAALLLWAQLSGIPLPKQHGFVLVLLLVFGSYVNGMIFFAAVRSVRRAITRWTQKIEVGRGGRFKIFFLESLGAHGLADEDLFKTYLSKDAWRLYVRLWTEVRQVDRLSPSFLLLKRYWVMAATYDGLAAALFLWSLLFVRWSFGFESARTPSLWVTIPAIVITSLLALGCLAEADRYCENQAEELVASIAAERSRGAIGKDKTPVGERSSATLDISAKGSSES
jgi:hypothetical protein